ncbi:TetR family transcriptional regulator C-terminal domain-containing protein [Tropicibacter oceani]|uniref:TetR family transcriptional regulator C-terminal domain-containing protein n=1 Tax=Tropicibacter oceani TaxID=3058420 RepID=A0ABY8QD30_9RHOB|nr:TetR family transcriptional regulator C-terminal domain-containing protein [Tropicibacter oceani]WGW02338.1 TetR family transcriptional regulator C-terminal domain-containing protein [Tropicibacter oceani]
MTRIRPSGKTRIQREKRQAIFEAALDVFSEAGLRGATLDQIAARAGLSKPNVVYYFDGKEAIYRELLEELLDLWIDPLRQLSAKGDPVAEILAYVHRKLDMSRDMPRESRLFATEMLQNAPHIDDVLKGTLKALVDEKTGVIQGWVEQGRIAPLDPHHLIFSIWATTQHYADFDVQVRGVLGAAREEARFDEAKVFLTTMYERLLHPQDDAPRA